MTSPTGHCRPAARSQVKRRLAASGDFLARARPAHRVVIDPMQLDPIHLGPHGSSVLLASPIAR